MLPLVPAMKIKMNRTFSRLTLDSVLVAVFVLVFLAYDNAIAATSPCGDALHSMLTPDHVVAQLTPSQENQAFIEKIAREALGEKTDKLTEEFKQAVNGPGCLGDPEACVARAAAEAMDPESKSGKNFLSDFFGKSCLVSGKDGNLPANLALAASNRSALMLNMIVGVGGVGLSYGQMHAKDANAEFPFAIMATTVVSVLIRSEVGCRNMAKTAPVTDQAAPPVSWGRTALSNYVSYGIWIVPSAGIYVGFLMAEDLIRGKEVFSKDKMEEYLREGAVSCVWDLGSNVLQVAYFDKLFLKQIPAGREALAKLLENRVFKGSLKSIGGKKVLIVYVHDMPGFLLDLGIRVTNSGVRNYGYIKLSDAVQNHFEKPKADVSPK